MSSGMGDSKTCVTSPLRTSPVASSNVGTESPTRTRSMGVSPTIVPAGKHSSTTHFFTVGSQRSDSGNSTRVSTDATP